MEKYDYDLVVIGAGSGGVRCARWSAGLGAKVAIVEEYRYGGTCVIRGCVPKKLMVYASEVHEEMKGAENYGWSCDGLKFDWATLKKNRDQEIARLEGIYQNLLDGKKVDRFDGHGKLIDDHTVEVNGKKITGERILLATGAKPSCVEIEGIEYTWSSNDVFTCEIQPKSLLVMGGGFIAVEMAGIFHGLGTKVDLVIRRDYVLRGFDQDCREFVQAEIEKKGIKIHKNLNVVKIEKVDDSLMVTFDNGEKEVYEQVLSALGRDPNTENLGLEQVGIKVGENGKILVNEKFQTNIPSVYAIGDCIDRIQLTPVATTEGTLLSEHLYNNKPLDMNYDHVAAAVFSQPPVCSVGPTEDALVKQGIDIEVYTSSFRALKHTLSGLEEKTFMKMIIDKKSRRVLALHMVGKDAPEIIQLGAVCLKAGLTKDAFDATIGIHPSSAEEFVTMRTPRS